MKPERWGSLLVQENYREENACDKRYNNNNNNNNKGSMGMGEVVPLEGVDPTLVLTNPGVQ